MQPSGVHLPPCLPVCTDRSAVGRPIAEDRAKSFSNQRVQTRACWRMGTPLGRVLSPVSAPGLILDSASRPKLPLADPVR